MIRQPVFGQKGQQLAYLTGIKPCEDVSPGWPAGALAAQRLHNEVGARVLARTRSSVVALRDGERSMPQRSRHGLRGCADLHRGRGPESAQRVCADQRYRSPHEVMPISARLLVQTRGLCGPDGRLPSDHQSHLLAGLEKQAPRHPEVLCLHVRAGKKAHSLRRDGFLVPLPDPHRQYRLGLPQRRPTHHPIRWTKASRARISPESLRTTGGTAKFSTTLRMQTRTPHANVTKTAIGYVRVSTQEQVSEGVSLDAQRDRLRAYCKLNDIRLIDIIADEGISGSTLERPGLQTALRMIKRGRANTLIVVKLDRLSRSLRDVCALVDDYFVDERHHLLSVCGMVNTHNAAGRMLMMNLANFNQFEREMISERTRESMQHMKAQGIKLGNPPYGYQYAHQVDDKGRRLVVPLAGEQEVIGKFASLHAAGHKFADIARKLNAAQIPARRGGEWCGRVVSVILQREGKYTVRPHKEMAPRVSRIHDKPASAARARELRAEGVTLRIIGVRLRKEGFVPLRGGKWHAASVLDLLRYRDPGDRAGTSQRAQELRAEGLSLREVGVRLAMEGHVPELGGAWYPARVSSLLATGTPSAERATPLL